jgi:hypothetical protein
MFPPLEQALRQLAFGYLETSEQIRVLRWAMRDCGRDPGRGEVESSRESEGSIWASNELVEVGQGSGDARLRAIRVTKDWAVLDEDMTNELKNEKSDPNFEKERVRARVACLVCKAIRLGIDEFQFMKLVGDWYYYHSIHVDDLNKLEQETDVAESS